jgi:polyhydroxyalkanoic acid synthase PhaR subunit
VADPASPIPDPMAAWRAFVTQSEQQWNAFLNQAMGTDQYSQAIGRMMEMYAGMQKAMADQMARYLGALNMPTRSDVMTLGDRLAMIEDRLAGIERLLTRGDGLGQGGGAVQEGRPPRTKQPPSTARVPGEPDAERTP